MARDWRPRAGRRPWAAAGSHYRRHSRRLRDKQEARRPGDDDTAWCARHAAGFSSFRLSGDAMAGPADDSHHFELGRADYARDVTFSPMHGLTASRRL